jgi:hypothetical protein
LSVEIQIASAAARQIAAGALLEELALRPGTDVVARVVQAPNGGRGLISLAGMLLSAKLPAGVEEGQRLQLQVVGAKDNEVLLQLRQEGTPEHAARHGSGLAAAAGALAVRGDGELLRAALTLQPPPLALPLPNGDAAEVELRPEEDGAGSDRRGNAEGEASFVLHSVAVGPIEVRLRLAGGVLRAGVVVDPALAADAKSASTELAQALARVTGAQASVDVSARPASAPRKPAPRIEEAFDAYA